MTRLLWVLTVALAALATGVSAQPSSRDPVRSEVRPIPNPPSVHPIHVSLWTDRSTYTIGQNVEVFFRVNQDSYLYLYNTDARGITRLIFPNAYDGDNFLRANATYRIPDRNYRLVATHPAGRETLYAVATTTPYEFLGAPLRSAAPRDSGYPRVYQSPDDIYERLERTARSEIEQQRADEHRGRPQAVPYQSPGTRSIRPEPWIPPAWGRAYATIRIIDRGYYYPDPYIPRPPYQPPYEPPWRPPYYEETGTLKLSSAPTRADVYIDGRFHGRTPFEIDLPPGHYDVHVYKPGYEPWRRMVRIRENRREAFTFRLYPY